MRELLVRYLEEQTPESFLALRQSVLASPDYNPYSDELLEASELLDQGKFEGARERLHSMLGTWVLTPRVHFMLAFAHQKVGDRESAEMEEAIGALLLQGILSTGDGSEGAPYLVSRVADEYDALEYLDRPSRGQSLVGKEERRLDRHQCEDGSCVWFDVTDQMAVLDRSFSSIPSPAKKWWQFWR